MSKKRRPLPPLIPIASLSAEAKAAVIADTGCESKNVKNVKNNLSTASASLVITPSLINNNNDNQSRGLTFTISQVGQTAFANSNSNSTSTEESSCFLKIKEEPLDESNEVTAQEESYVVDTEQNITIKTEPRVIEDEATEDSVDSIEANNAETPKSLVEERPKRNRKKKTSEYFDSFDTEDEDEELGNGSSDDFDYPGDESDSDFDIDDEFEEEQKVDDPSKPDDDKIKVDLNLVKDEEIDISEDAIDNEKEEEEDKPNGFDPDGKKGSFDFNGMTIETIGDYSKCPKCLKNIKSTFIIRHIKLHDVTPEHYICPEKKCSLKSAFDFFSYPDFFIFSLSGYNLNNKPFGTFT